LSIQKEDELHVGEDTTKVGKVAHFTGKNTSQAWGRYSGQRLMAQRSIVSIPPCKVAITKVKLDKYLRTKIQSHQVGKDKGNYKEEILEKV
jgi:large subunit ribosomal protein L26e